jgi:hypothetical protein
MEGRRGRQVAVTACELNVALAQSRGSMREFQTQAQCTDRVNGIGRAQLGLRLGELMR